MSFTYFQHGRRHKKGGSDEIPGLGPQFANAWANNVTIASGASVVTPIDFTGFATNNDELFDLGGDSFGRSVDTIRIKVPGTYKVFVSAQYTGIAAGRKPVLYYDPPLNHGAMQFGHTGTVAVTGIDTTTSFWEPVYGDIVTDAFTFPIGGAAFVTNDAAGTFQAYVQMWIELVDPARIVLV